MKDYIFVRAWEFMYYGNAPQEINRALHAARVDNAPFDALVKDEDGTWICIGETSISNHQFLMDIAVAEFGLPKQGIKETDKFEAIDEKVEASILGKNKA